MNRRAILSVSDKTADAELQGVYTKVRGISAVFAGMRRFKHGYSRCRHACSVFYTIQRPREYEKQIAKALSAGSGRERAVCRKPAESRPAFPQL